MSDREVSYLAFRCVGCGRLITKLELMDRWQKSELEGLSDHSVCPCGSRQLRPTNPKLWEELFLPRVWKLWWREVRGKR